MYDIKITKEDNGEIGRYIATIEGKEGKAELVFSHKSSDTISADHTYANELAGTGAASALVEYLIKDARANNFKIIPACSYVAKLAQRNSDWGDVII